MLFRSLSHDARADARRLLRQVERSGIKFEVASDAESAGACFDQMVLLHRQRWNAVGKAGCFAPRYASQAHLNRGKCLQIFSNNTR